MTNPLPSTTPGWRRATVTDADGAVQEVHASPGVVAAFLRAAAEQMDPQEKPEARVISPSSGLVGGEMLDIPRPLPTPREVSSSAYLEASPPPRRTSSARRA